MRWVLFVVALLSFASRSVVADGPWGSNCPPGYHGVLNDNPESPDYGSVDCVPDAPVNPGTFAIWWPVDAVSLSVKVAACGAVVLIGVLTCVVMFVFARRYARRLMEAAIGSDPVPPSKPKGRAWDHVFDGGGMWNDSLSDAENARRIARAKARWNARRNRP